MCNCKSCRKRDAMEFSTFINEEKGVVAVRINNGMDQLRRELDLFFYKNNVDFNYDLWCKFKDEYGKQVDKLVGLATCNYEAGDEFNAEFGHNLAKERVMAYFEVYRTKMFTMLTNFYDDFAEKASRRAEQSDERRCERIDSVCAQIESIKL